MFVKEEMPLTHEEEDRARYVAGLHQPYLWGHPRRFEPHELEHAAMGDTTKAMWNPKALDVFLSLIGNAKEE